DESREVGAHGPAAHSEKTHPRRSGDGLAPAPRCAAPPSLPRGNCRWRERRRLLAPGERPAFPGITPSGIEPLQLPVTVAGPRRTCTGFRKSPFACNDDASLSRFPPQRNHEGDRERERREADDERHQRL